MNLALYSGGTSEQNDEMNQFVVQRLSKLHSNEVVYVTTPKAKNDYALTWLHEYFDKYMTTTYIPYFIDSKNDQKSITAMANAKIIIVTGGNTFFILKYLKESGTDTLLKRFSGTEGFLIGFSAGSIIQTPSIEIAHYPTNDCDDNEVHLSDLTGLGFTKYEIQAHYQGSVQEDNELIDYSRKTNRPIYALRDGSGIVVEQEKEKMFGNIVMFDSGEKIKVACAC